MEALSSRRLERIAAAGAALTVIVVAASALLRLGTTLDAGGNVAGELPAALQRVVRIAHRLAASGVAIAAFAALVVAMRTRALPRASPPLALWAAIALTALLAVVGPLTPGYHFVAVTIANAAGGMALACAFVFLAGDASRGAPARDRRLAAACFVVLAALLAHAALGTAASASAMHGERALDPWHVALGPAAAAGAVALAAYRHRESPAPPLRAVIAAVALLQMALGALLAIEPSLLGIAWAHAMIACALTVCVATLAAAALR